MIIFAVATALLIVALIPTVITWAPHWLASTSGLNASQRADEIGRVRTALLAVLAGAVAVVGAIYTGRTFALNRQTYEHARETTRKSHELDQARLTTERFTRAVDQLGSEKLDVRLGGIYGLERLARESQKEHGPIMEILTAFVREHAAEPAGPEKATVAAQEDAEAGPTSPDAKANGATAARNSPSTDVQAVFTVLGRRTNEYDTDRPLDLGQTVLAGANLDGANLQRASLREADLQRASLREADLQGADITQADLQGARLIGADLQGALLSGADLQRASLHEADLRGANLTGANLQGASLEKANLQGASLYGANLQRASLREADLQGANLTGADLQRALLAGADLQEASLDMANLWRAHLDEADLQGALLVRANLQEADLQRTTLYRADLESATLAGANLQGAWYDEETCWPEEFKPSPRSDALARG